MLSASADIPLNLNNCRDVPSLANLGGRVWGSGHPPQNETITPEDYAVLGMNYCGRQEETAILISRLLLRMRRMYVTSFRLDFH